MTNLVCQCPHTGSYHFYVDMGGGKKGENYCVNALIRAPIISTVPLQTPVFMRLPRPISAGNSQNILNMHTFSHIFWAG